MWNLTLGFWGVWRDLDGQATKTSQFDTRERYGNFKPNESALRFCDCAEIWPMTMTVCPVTGQLKRVVLDMAFSRDFTQPKSDLTGLMGSQRGRNWGPNRREILKRQAEADSDAEAVQDAFSALENFVRES